MPNPTSYTPDILKFTKYCFLKIFKENFEYKKVGVILSNFVNEKIIQQDLFSPKNNFDQEDRAKNVLDKINRKFKKNKIFYAQENFNKNDFSKSDKKTQNFTTSWENLLIVN